MNTDKMKSEKSVRLGSRLRVHDLEHARVWVSEEGRLIAQCQEDLRNTRRFPIRIICVYLCSSVANILFLSVAFFYFYLRHQAFIWPSSISPVANWLNSSYWMWR